MILEYEGFAKTSVLIMEEAENISYAIVGFPGDVKEEIEKKFEDEVLPHCKDSTTEELKRLSFYGEEIVKYIQDRTNCCDYPQMIINKSVTDIMGNVNNFLVVSLFDQNKSKTYIFEKGHKVFILNNSGKTVMKI